VSKFTIQNTITLVPLLCLLVWSTVKQMIEHTIIYIKLTGPP